MKHTWTNATGDDRWATPGNWDTGRVPSKGDTCVVAWDRIPDRGIVCKCEVAIGMKFVYEGWPYNPLKYHQDTGFVKFTE